MPITGISFGMLTGLTLGTYYSRRRLLRFGFKDTWSSFFYLCRPLREMILLMAMAAIVIGSFPQESLADNPPYDPVFYYYHSDHLGSASVMTSRTGAFVQQYCYTAFGKERYQNNASAFSVTNRYTGQQLDDDTGLYFYNSRYYDPELARFVQADTIVPSADTSQALNRYAYVKNNPLKFTDPSGHGWFSKFMKKWIGTIIAIALTFVFGLGSTLWSQFLLQPIS